MCGGRDPRSWARSAACSRRPCVTRGAPWSSARCVTASKAPAIRGARRTLKIWLGYPGQSWQRARPYSKVTGEAGGGFDPIGGAKDLLGLSDDRELPGDVQRLLHKAPERVRMQEAGGT